MESSKAGSAPISFVHQVLHNNMLLLTVLMAVCAATYFVYGLFMLLGR